MARTPRRDSDVYFIGAGLGQAFGLPNTHQLLKKVHKLCDEEGTWEYQSDLESRLREAYEFFYPIDRAQEKGFIPYVPDFFSILRAYVRTAAGMSGGFKRSERLYRRLRRSLAHVLFRHLSRIDSDLETPHPKLEEILQPGNFVITTNWDILLERYAYHHDVPLRMTKKKPSEEVTLLKLHGSIDWCGFQQTDQALTRDDYRVLKERLFADNRYGFGPYKEVVEDREEDDPDNPILRIPVHAASGSKFSTVERNAQYPFLLTMGRAKVGEDSAIREVWADAYYALSSAEDLEFIGYSFPEDDIEIRSLIAGGIERGPQDPAITVTNPSPSVHSRFQEFFHHDFDSDFKPVSSP